MICWLSEEWKNMRDQIQIMKEQLRGKKVRANKGEV
jgi:hypothetical protein